MSSRRHYSDTDRTRRAAGAILIVAGALILALLGRYALGGVSTALVFLMIPPLLLIGIGVRFLRHVVAAIDVDLTARKYGLIRDGKPAGGGELDSLGPLRVSREERTVKSTDPEKADRTYVQYTVRPAGYGFIELYSVKTSSRARRKMEALARTWRVSCRSLDGPVRAFEHIDAPLHVRLRGDAEARTTVALDPKWHIALAPIFRGHALVSSHRSYEPLLMSIPYAVLPILLVVYTRGDVASLFREMLADPLGRVLAALAGVVAGVVVWKIAEGVLDTFRPGTIEVNDGGVRYRWSRMAFDRIEEITTGGRIEIVGDRRTLAIAESFCPRAALKPVAHELQRLILEAAAKRGI